MVKVMIFFSHPRKNDFFLFSLPFLNNDTQYRQCRLFLPVPITTDCSSNPPDYAYSHYIGTYIQLHLLIQENTHLTLTIIENSARSRKQYRVLLIGFN